MARKRQKTGSSSGSRGSQVSKGGTSQAEAAPSQEADEEEEQFALTQTQLEIQVTDISSTMKPTARHQFNALSDDEKHLVVSTVTRYILMKGSKTETIDLKKLKKEAFTSPALQSYQGLSAKLLLGEAQRALRAVWGVELAQPAEKWFARHRSLRDQYFLVNALPGGAHAQDLHRADGRGRERLLLMTVLGFLVLGRGAPLPAPRLARQLEAVDPDVADDAAAARKIGLSVPDALLKFCRERYLVREVEQDPETGEEVTLYRLGPRVGKGAEMSKRQIMQFVFEVMGETPDESVLADLSDGDDS
mmetsp:Transcript_17001/g.27652  ORF Transcript_17001/g.27652 Transcript_17001/m.27652 type:complete len:304 (-) Transcript_17001:171-1082(-)